MPNEFKALYSEFDGFGTLRDGEVDWFFLPLSKLPEHANGVRSWIQKTHPEIAKRFVPFVDWGNGEASVAAAAETLARTPLSASFFGAIR